MNTAIYRCWSQLQLCGLIKKHSNRPSYRMQGDGLRGNVVPSSYVEGSIDQLAGSPPPYQGFLPAMEPAESSSRSVDNLHSPPEPAGSSYSSPVFVSVSTRRACGAAGPFNASHALTAPCADATLPQLWCDLPACTWSVSGCCLCSTWLLVRWPASQNTLPCIPLTPSRPGCRR